MVDRGVEWQVILLRPVFRGQSTHQFCSVGHAEDRPPQLLWRVMHVQAGELAYTDGLCSVAAVHPDALRIGDEKL